MKATAVIQARMNSTRLPGKVLMPIGRRPAIAWVVERIRRCAAIEHVLLATTDSSADDLLAEWVDANGISCFRGSESDVLGRYYYAGLSVGLKPEDVLVRITGDCPFIDPNICAEVIALMEDPLNDYASNVRPPTFPDGLDCEAIRFSALEQSHREAKLGFEREHVTQYISRHSEIFKTANHKNTVDLSHMRWTLDSHQDYAFLCAVAEKLSTDDFLMSDIIRVLEQDNTLEKINSGVERNEGLQKSMEEEGFY